MKQDKKAKQGADEFAAILNGGEWDVAWREVATLTPYAKNARKNEKTVPYLKRSISRFGFRVPLVVDSEGVVVCGHTRLKAALELGMEKVPCVSADDLTPAEVDAFRLADNKISEMSEWDFDMLNEQLNELKDEFDTDMNELGFSAFQTGDVDDLFDPQNQAEPKEKQASGPISLTYTCPYCGEEHTATVTKDDVTDEPVTLPEGEA